MNVCKKIRKYDGTKSQIILEMIAEKRRKEIRKNLKKIVKDNGFDVHEKKFHRLRKQIEKLRKEKSTINRELENQTTKKDYKIKWNTYAKCFEPNPLCHCDDLVKQKLQNAQDLFALGKHTEARKIWDKVMKHYNLAGIK